MEQNVTQEQNKKSNWIFPIILVILLVVGGFVFTQKQITNKIESSPKPSTQQTIKTDSIINEASPTAVEGGMFYFKPNEIRVKKGENVKITFTNVEGRHDFVLDEFNVKTAELKADESETFEFIADKAGEFEFYCSVTDHKQMGMVGKLIVEE